MHTRSLPPDSDRIKAKLVPRLRSLVAWERLLQARDDPSGRPHDGYSSLQLLEALDHVTFINSELADNCHVTCQKMGWVCSKRWAFAINACDIMQVALARLFSQEAHKWLTLFLLLGCLPPSQNLHNFLLRPRPSSFSSGNAKKESALSINPYLSITNPTIPKRDFVPRMMPTFC